MQTAYTLYTPYIDFPLNSQPGSVLSGTRGSDRNTIDQEALPLVQTWMLMITTINLSQTYVRIISIYGVSTWIGLRMIEL